MYIGEPELGDFGILIENWWNDGETRKACSMLGFIDEDATEVLTSVFLGIK